MNYAKTLRADALVFFAEGNEENKAGGQVGSTGGNEENRAEGFKVGRRGGWRTDVL